MKKIIILIVIFITALAQEPQELTLLLNKIENNYKIRSYQNLYRMYLHKAEAVSSFKDPVITIKPFIFPIQTRLGPQWLVVDFTQPLPYFGLLKNKSLKEELNAQLVKIKKDKNLLQLKLQARKLYYKMYEKTKLQEIIKNYLDRYVSLKNFVEINVQTGKTSLADLVTLDQLIEELQTELQTLQDEYNALQTKLNKIIEEDRTFTATVPDTLFFPEIDFPDSIDPKHPFLSSYDLEQQISEQAIKINELENKPQFFVGASYSLIGKYESPVLDRTGTDAFGVKIGFTIPMYQKKYDNIEFLEKERIEALKLQQKDTRKLFEYQIVSLNQDYEALRKKLQLYNKLKEMENSVIRLRLNELSVEKSNFNDVLKEEIKLISYDKNILFLIVKAYLIDSEVRFYSGN